MPEELFLEPCEDIWGLDKRGDGEDHLLDHRWVDPRHVLVLWDIRRGLRSLTWGEVTGAAKGTAVPQLEGGQRLRRLDTAHCEEVVERLTEKRRLNEGHGA